jgi:hypothetical protein
MRTNDLATVRHSVLPRYNGSFSKEPSTADPHLGLEKEEVGLREPREETDQRQTQGRTQEDPRQKATTRAWRDLKTWSPEPRHSIGL